MLVQFLESYSLCGGPTLEQFDRDYIPWQGSHTTAGSCGEEEVTKCYELTAAPISQYPVPLGGLMGKRLKIQE